MIYKTPKELLKLAYQTVQPHRIPGAGPMSLVIRKGELQLLQDYDYNKEDTYIMHYTKKMLTKGLSGAQWDTLKKRLIKHQKEIKE